MTLMGMDSSLNRDEMHEQREQIVFEWKQEVLQKYVVPALLRKKLKLLDEMISAEKIVMGEYHASDAIIETTSLRSENKIDLLEQYDSTVSEVKLALTRCNTFSELLPVMNALIRLQEDYMQAFRNLFRDYSEALPEEVNSREMIDTGKLLLALKQGEPDNKMVWAIERELTRIKKIEGI
ncbi:MAG: hypothetical protein ACKO7B_10930 [Flavobacteriales bacterium]